jgi:hypothetical protein
MATRHMSPETAGNLVNVKLVNVASMPMDMQLSFVVLLIVEPSNVPQASIQLRYQENVVKSVFQDQLLNYPQQRRQQPSQQRHLPHQQQQSHPQRQQQHRLFVLTMAKTMILETPGQGTA